MKKYLLVLLFLCISQSYAEIYLTPEQQTGEELFTVNCKACHLLEKQLVGPSLLEIAHVYKKDTQGIVLWSMNPGHKRKNLIKMPPMSHVGEKGLNNIASYILAITKGKKFNPKKKKARTDPFAKYPVAKIQRMFMPDAGPAAIAVSLNDNLHLCWDAGTCQFRYAWTGGYIDLWPVVRGNGNGLTTIKGEKFSYVEQGNPFAKDSKAKFHGYKRKNGLPIFMYTVDGTDVEASFSSKNSKSVSIHLKTNSKAPLTYTPNTSLGKWSADKGEVKEGTLQLNAEESKAFTVTFSAGDK